MVLSVREKAPTGPFHVYPRIWRTDAAMHKKEPLLPAHPYSYTVSFSEDRKSHRDIRIDVINPDTVEPHVDSLLVELMIVDGTARQRTYQLGHFLVTGRSIVTTGNMRTGTITGSDHTVQMADNKTPVSLIMGYGADPGASAANLLRIFGIDDRLIDIPSAGFEMTDLIAWDAGTPWLDVVNDVLKAGAMYPLWTTGDGIYRSRRMDDWRLVTPVAHYGGDDGAYVLEPVTEDPDFSMLRNRVTVFRDMPDDEEDISFTAEVTDPTAPMHPMRLAERRGVTYPVYKDEFINDSSLPDDPVGTIVAAIRAIYELSERASYMQNLTIRTLVDDVLDAHQAVSLDIPFGGRHYYRGNWRQSGWTIEGNGPAVSVTRKLHRIEAWQ